MLVIRRAPWEQWLRGGYTRPLDQLSAAAGQRAEGVRCPVGPSSGTSRPTGESALTQLTAAQAGPQEMSPAGQAGEGTQVSKGG